MVDFLFFKIILLEANFDNCLSGLLSLRFTRILSSFMLCMFEIIMLRKAAKCAKKLIFFYIQIDIVHSQEYRLSRRSEFRRLKKYFVFFLELRIRC